MRSYHVNRSRRKGGKLIWPLLIAVLVSVNVYLFVFRGLPSKKGQTGVPQSAPSAAPESPQALAATPESAPAPAQHAAVFASNLGEMRGIAGMREASTNPKKRRAMRQALRSSSPMIRFDLETAGGVAGQRSMEQWCSQEEGQIGTGQTFSTALNTHEMAEGQVNELIAALSGTMEFRHCRPGEAYELYLTPQRKVQRFVYHKTPLMTYEAAREMGKLVGREVELDAEVQVADIGVRIGKGESMYLSLDRAGEHPALVMMIVDIFAWDIDFYVDTHPGDTIRLVVEKMTLNGTFVRYGNILAAEYAGDVGTHQAFRYTVQTGKEKDKEGFYDETGGSLRKAFLKTPLKFARISSGFGRRVHPILGFNKMHNGIDFAAPIGTPIWAPADGTVIFAGRKGASGKLLVLRHANGYQTIYAHLHGIKRGVRRGARVRQKETIAWVGNTGRSTGPHLHYGMKLRGRHVNPMRQKFPPAKPVPKAESEQYLKTIVPMRKRLMAIQLPQAPRTAAVESETQSKDAG